MSRKYVWRLVVDKWPTPDGLPFDSQPFAFWEAIVDSWTNARDDVPGWVPDIGPWLVDNSPGSLGHNPGYHIVQQDLPDYSTGYGGDYVYLMNVPAAPTRRFFTRNTVAKLRDQLREWGCEAHIERAPCGEWEAVE